MALGFSRGHSGVHAPLHSWLVFLSLNPFTSCGDSVWGTCVNSVCGLPKGYFLAIRDVMGGEMLPVEALQPYAEAPSGRRHLLLSTGLAWAPGHYSSNNILLAVRGGWVDPVRRFYSSHASALSLHDCAVNGLMSFLRVIYSIVKHIRAP